MAPQLDSYFKQVDEMAESFIDRLRRAVAIPSVSAEDARRPDVVKVCHSLRVCKLSGEHLQHKHRWESSWQQN